MKRRIIWGVVALIVVAAVGFFGFAPGIVESGMNKVVATSMPKVTPETRKLHASLQVADMHGDTLLWSRDLNKRSNRGQIDLQRLLDGNVAVQVFSSVTKTPKGQNYVSNSDKTDNITLLTFAQLQPPATWGSLLERSLFHARKLDRAAAASGGRLRVIRTPADLDAVLADRAKGVKVVGAMLSIPIAPWSRSGPEALAEARRLEAEEQLLRRDAMARDMSEMLRGAWGDARRARFRLDYHRRTQLPLLEKTLVALRTDYANGRVPLASVIDGYTMLTMARMASTQASAFARFWYLSSQMPALRKSTRTRSR